MSSPLPPYNSTVVISGRVFTMPKDYYMPIPQRIIDGSEVVIHTILIIEWEKMLENVAKIGLVGLQF